MIRVRHLLNCVMYSKRLRAEECAKSRGKIKIKKIKKVVDISVDAIYNAKCVTEMVTKNKTSGCGSAWLERLVWDQEVAGSNPVTPIFMRV